MIYITGFPHTGTSFLSEVVYRLGLSFGTITNLKGANQMNRHGHYEHLDIRNLIWGNIEKHGEAETLNPCDSRTYHVEKPKPDIQAQIQDTIEAEGIEAYKDTFYPVIHKYLPPPSLILTTYRSTQEVYLAPIRANMHSATASSVRTLNQAMGRWYKMLGDEHQEDIIKLVNYDALFKPDSFRKIMGDIAGWLDIEPSEKL